MLIIVDNMGNRSSTTCIASVVGIGSNTHDFLVSNKNDKGVEKNAYVHFGDERNFKAVMRVVGKRKSKKNRVVGFVLTAVSAESSSEDDEVEIDCSSENIRSSS